MAGVCCRPRLTPMVRRSCYLLDTPRPRPAPGVAGRAAASASCGRLSGSGNGNGNGGAQPTCSLSGAATHTRGCVVVSGVHCRSFSAATAAAAAPETATATDPKSDELRRIRNIGVIAHIDAGKTTTTERMLYLVGRTRHQGSVDSGDTVTDFMVQERERGITIQSASVSLQWGKHHINLIDTPGHVDFSIEVERSIRVLDGVVLVLDGVAGVQAQTETVWRTARRFNVPAVVFVNKMDKAGADFDEAMKSLERRLGLQPLRLQLPIGLSETFCGAVDLLTMQAGLYEVEGADRHSGGGKGGGGGAAKVGLGTLRASHRDMVELRRLSVWEAEEIVPGIAEQAKAARAQFLESLAEVDEEFMETYLSAGEAGGVYTPNELLAAVRRATLSGMAVPVTCGAAMKGIGVEPLMDCVCSFLPSPLDRPKVKGRLTGPIAGHNHNLPAGVKVRGKRVKKAAKHKGGDILISPHDPELVALAFKVCHAKHRKEPLVFFRVYSGELKPKQLVLNSTQGVSERPLELLQMYADDFTAVTHVKAGQVAAMVGMKHTNTGDTLVAAHGSYPTLQLDGVTVPPPVFSIVVEPDSSAHEASLESALRVIGREDPSLRVETDKETGQTILRGIGELHLEIVLDRLRREFKVPVSSGEPNVAYRETVSLRASLSKDYDRQIGTKRMYAGLDIEVERIHTHTQTHTQQQPNRNSNSSSSSSGGGGGGRDGQTQTQTHAAMVEEEETVVELWQNVEDELDGIMQEALIGGITDACTRGPLGGARVVGVKVAVTGVRLDEDSTPGAMRYAAAHIFREALLSAGPVMLEPLMAVEVMVGEAFVGTVLNDLTSARRGQIRTVDTPCRSEHGAMTRHIVQADVPLAELVGYSTALRSMTAGEAALTMELIGYGEVDMATVQMNQQRE